MTDLASVPRPTIDLQVDGPTEAEWRSYLRALPTFEWPAASRLVVVSPHPDDETLGAGGLIATALDRGLPVTVVAVTDGESSHPGRDMGAQRRTELTDAMRALAPDGGVDVRRLGLPDGHIGDRLADLVDALVDLVEPGDLVACPLHDDGHPDHEAVAVGATEAARRRGSWLRTFGVWAWHRHVPASSALPRGQLLPLSPVVRRRKQLALAFYRSQLDGDQPVLPPGMLLRLDREFEVLVRPEGAR
ncbi:MAG: PIG-L family deacetylase [Actinobacteria bacterium]|nr:PIG-L family deacetylase [Actinomycetota bacterium]